MPSETTEGRFESLVTLNRALLTQHLLRGFAHDLRNQLQVLALGVTLENASSSPLLGERLEHAIHSMANSLDQLARLGRMEPDAQQHANLGEVISGVVRLAELQRNLPSRRIEVSAGVADTITVAIPGQILEQILLNLVANAKEAPSSDDAPIAILVERRPPGAVAIAVVDHGSGLPAGATEWWATERERQSHGGIGYPVAVGLVTRYGGTVTEIGGTPHRVVVELATTDQG